MLFSEIISQLCNINPENMKTLTALSVVLSFLFIVSCSDTETKYKKVIQKDANGYEYESVDGDMMKVRIYTLANGLKVYLTDNDNEPRIQTLIAVKAGSSYDPVETTGLAHYLEHMMFKGTSKMGTENWAEEEKVLAQISDLFEKRKATNDSLEKKRIYKQIDSLSTIASKFAIPSEYDKMMSQIGARGTNAFTSNEQTVYMNDIPSNELERWLKIESERFGKLVLRLFHTELETVYEEFNMYQDDDDSRSWEALDAGLYPGHPYGEQTTIGKGEHLKNPSMVNIHKYFDKYYVPNNMAICMSGDIDMEATIKMIDKYFGGLKPNKELVHPKYPEIKPAATIVTKEISGPMPESVKIGFRLDGIKSADVKYAQILSRLLSNGQAGLIDLNLVQKQKVLEAWAFSSFMNDKGSLVFSGTPREKQKLEEVKDLMLAQLEKIKKGEFDEWMLKSIVSEYKVSELRELEYNYRAFRMVDAFISGREWIDIVSELDGYDKITKDEVVKFANEKFEDNYVCVYKRTGKAENIMKVDKPAITPIEINRTSESQFMKDIKAMAPPPVQPVFVDYDKMISQDMISEKVPLRYIKNETNQLFSLNYIIDMGSFHDKKLALAVEYLPYIGTEKYSPEDLRKEMYRYGLSVDVYTGERRSYVFVDGLDENFAKGVEFLEEILSSPKGDTASYNDFVDGILKQRQDNKQDKYTMFWSGLMNYGKYDGRNPFNDILSENELRAINPDELIALLKDVLNYKHHIFYYGSLAIDDVKKQIMEKHVVPATLKDYPKPVEYKERSYDKPRVFFTNYDQVQTNVYMFSRDVKYNKDMYPYINLFNQYYGSGLSSIVFQEIREAKGFAYTSFASYSIPAWPFEYHYVSAYVATQPDKLNDAVSELLKMMNTMVRSDKMFQTSKDGIMKQIQSSRITRASVFWNWLNNQDKGINYDVRKDYWEKTPGITQDVLEGFFNEHVKGKNYIILVQGDKNKVDFNILKKFGDVEEVPIEVMYGY